MGRPDGAGDLADVPTADLLDELQQLQDREEAILEELARRQGRQDQGGRA